MIFWRALRQLELENARMLNAMGELSEENATAYEKLRKSYEHLFKILPRRTDHWWG